MSGKDASSPEVAGLDPVEETGLMVAYFRACESRRDDALVRDPFAVEIAESVLSVEKRAQYARSPTFAASVDLLALRTGWIDERLLAAGPRQIVNLGAGADARAFRLPLPAAAVLYQVDTAPVIRWASGFLSRHRPRCAVRWVAADLAEAGELLPALASAGLDLGRPVFWILEGLAEFLGRAATAELLAALTTASVPESRLVLSLLDPELVRFARQSGDTAFPWKKLDPPEEALSHLSAWEVTVLSGGELAAHYGRALGNLFHVVEGVRRGR